MVTGKRQNLDVTPENIGDNLADLIDFTKTKNIHTNNYFTSFIKKLIQKQSPGINTLKTWIELFLAEKDL